MDFVLDPLWTPQLIAAVTGIKPKGTRHVAHTSLMGVARVVLGIIVLILAYLAFRAYSG